MFKNCGNENKKFKDDTNKKTNNLVLQKIK